MRAGLSVLSGVLLALAYPGRDWDLLAWVSLLPLLLATADTRPRTAAWLGWIAGTTSFLLSMHWIVYTIAHHTGVPALLALIPYLLLATVMGLFPATSTALWTAASRSGFPLVVAMPVSWVALEWVRSVFPLGFPWLLLGYTLHRRIALIQAADLAGVYGLSALIALVNAALFVAAHREVSRRSRAGYVAIATGSVAGAVAYGLWRTSAIQGADVVNTVRVALVQGNIEQDRKWDPDYQDETVTRYEWLSLDAATRRPDIIVWPETATPFFFQLEGPERERVAAVSERVGIPLLFGSPGFDYDPDGHAYLLNRAYAMDGQRGVLGTYDKQVLVPFGEYVPFRWLLPFAREIVEGAAPFRPGSNQAPLVVGAHLYGVLICYEAIFPQLARRAVLDGATVLANLTNDAWFGRTVAPAQHLAMAALRAVENRRPLIRAANTGYSAVVDVTGRILERTELFTTDTRVATIAWPALSAPYTRWGDAFAYGCLAGAALMIVACVARPRHGIFESEELDHGTICATGTRHGGRGTNRDTREAPLTSHPAKLGSESSTK